MNKLLTTSVGGFPLTLDDLRWPLGQLASPNQQGIYQAFNNILRGFGDDFIVQGCVLGGISGAFTLTEGWVLLAGELLKVDAQSAFDEAINSTFVKVTTFDSRGNKTFQNASVNDVYEINRGVISGAGGSLDYNGIPIFKTEKLFADTTTGLVSLRTKVIEIGDWNMDTTPSVAVTHGFAAGFQLFNKLRSINVFIRADGVTPVYPLNSMVNTTTGVINGGVNIIGSTTITLSRVDSGVFDSASWSTVAGFNRGWITIEYEA